VPERSFLERLEERFGFPPLDDVKKLVTGDTGKRVNLLVARLERMSKDSSGILGAVELLKLVRELDQQGTLQRLLDLLKELSPIVKGKQAGILIERLGKLETMLQSLLKE